MKKHLIFTVVLLLIVSLFVMGCQQAAPDPTPDPEPTPDPVEEVETVNIQLATTFAESSNNAEAMKKFKEIIEAESDGKVTADLFFGGSMGTSESMAEAVSLGSLDGMVAGFTFFNYYAPEHFYLDIPFALVNHEHWQNIWDSELGDAARAAVEKEGNQRVVAAFYRGQRHMLAKKPVRSPEDMRGIKQRLPGIQSWLTVWQDGIGSTPVSVTITEVYTALSTGVVDAVDADLSTAISSKYYEPMSHVSLTEHLPMTTYFSFNVDFLDGLNETTRNLIVKAAGEGADYVTEKSLVEEEELLSYLESQGKEIVRLTTEEKQVFIDAAKPVLEEVFKDFVVTYDEVMQYAD